MQAVSQPEPANVFLRGDTVFGICQAVGEDFGFNPLYLRLAFAAPLIWNPLAVVGAYLGLGLVVLASRLLVRIRRPAFARASAGEPAKVQSVAAPAAPRADNESVAEILAVAA